MSPIMNKKRTSSRRTPRKAVLSSQPSKRAVVLLSGGLDSATTLFLAKKQGYHTHCLIFHYGQRHRKEIQQAQKLARLTQSPQKIVRITFPWKGSALLDKNVPLPQHRTISPRDIPSTYVPARNIIFLSFAASFAETVGARVIFIGANAIDYSGYPDCRPEFYSAFSRVLRSGLKSGVEKKAIKIKTPLIHMTKAQIIHLGLQLQVPFQFTWSCYKGGRLPCGKCDSCCLRMKGFQDMGLLDPLMLSKRKRS